MADDSKMQMYEEQAMLIERERELQEAQRGIQQLRLDNAQQRIDQAIAATEKKFEDKLTEILKIVEEERQAKTRLDRIFLNFSNAGLHILFIILAAVSIFLFLYDNRLQNAINDQRVKLEEFRKEIRILESEVNTSVMLLQQRVDEQLELIGENEAMIDHLADQINKHGVNSSILMDTINSQKKTISEKGAVIASRGVDINRLNNKINELAPEHTSVMLLGGWHDFPTNSTIIYNSMEKSWKNCNLTLPRTLGSHKAVILNNEIYIFGGYGITQEPQFLYKLGTGNKWEKMADMTEERFLLSQSYVVFNSEIWVIGGSNGINALKSVEKYNPKTKKWTKMPELNELRRRAAATVIDGKIYVSGGSGRIENSVEVYDPEKEKWKIFIPSLPHAVGSHILIGNHSHLIVIGGDLSNHEATNRVWKMNVLDPKRKWKEMPYLRQKRYHSGAVIIADELMVFGGSINNITRTDSVEIFDGVEWKNGAPLPDIRGSFASIPLTCAQERLFLKRFCQNS